MEEDQGAAAAVPGPSATRKKREEKSRKKDPRSWENVSKAIASLNDAGKLSAIHEKYNELYNEFRKVNANYQNLEKHATLIQKENDHNQSELAKSIIARARLENLCRELQKQNKQIKEENIAKIKEEEERRKEVSLKFSDKLTDINKMMDENKEKSDKLREENQKMTAKLAELYSQFQKREEDLSKMSKQMDLERQYAQANLAKMEFEFKAEKEIYCKEYALMHSNLEKSEKHCSGLLETVKALQGHVDIYKSQYKDFESTMSKSNKVFDNFKSEMSTMSKQVTTLEKEAQSWRSKWQDSASTILDLTEMKRNQDLALQGAERKVEQLQKLCRQLQVDRAAFLKLLKNHGIEPTSQICVEPISQICVEMEKPAEAASKKDTKMTKKEQELQLLKSNLRAVQDELNRLREMESKVNSNSEEAASLDNVEEVDPIPDEGAAASRQYLKLLDEGQPPAPSSPLDIAAALLPVLNELKKEQTNQPAVQSEDPISDPPANEVDPEDPASPPPLDNGEVNEANQ